MGRPKKGSGRRGRINLNFNLDDKKESAAFEILSGQSRTHSATIFVTNLVLSSLTEAQMAQTNLPPMVNMTAGYTDIPGEITEPPDIHAPIQTTSTRPHSIIQNNPMPEPNLEPEQEEISFEDIETILNTYGS